MAPYTAPYSVNTQLGYQPAINNRNSSNFGQQPDGFNLDRNINPQTPNFNSVNSGGLGVDGGYAPVQSANYGTRSPSGYGQPFSPIGGASVSAPTGNGFSSTVGSPSYLEQRAGAVSSGNFNQFNAQSAQDQRLKMPNNEAGFDWGQGVGLGIQGLGAVASIANAWIGYESLQESKDQFETQTKFANRNLVNQAKSFNSQLDDRQGARLGRGGRGQYSSVSQNRAKYGVSEERI